MKVEPAFNFNRIGGDSAGKIGQKCCTGASCLEAGVDHGDTDIGRGAICGRPSDIESSGKADKTPRTARGRATLRKLLDAAAIEFGERGFHDASISGITRRAGTALGSFYTYFDSKDAIFRALVQDMSAQVGVHASAAMQGAKRHSTEERGALQGFLEFAREHKEIYRIIDEAEFVDSDSYRRALRGHRLAHPVPLAGRRGDRRNPR